MNNSLAERDEIFKNVHALLKPLGYSKKSHIIFRKEFELSWGLVVTSQVWNTTEHVDFDIDVVAAHAEYNPHKKYGVKTGLGPSCEHLIRISLAKESKVPKSFWSISGGNQSATVQNEVFSTIADSGLALLSSISSLQGIVALHSSRGQCAGYMPRSWALCKLGLSSEATEVIQNAIEDAADENQRLRAIEWQAELSK